MADRYTRRDAEKAFERLTAITGHRIANNYNDVGAWTLDYNATYGGFVIEEISSATGAINHVPEFGMRRKTAREFCDWVRAVLTGFELAAPETYNTRLKAFYSAQGSEF